MAKIYMYTILMVAMLIFLNLGGVSTLTSQILSNFGYGHGANYQNWQIWIQVGIIMTVSFITVAIGIFTKTSGETTAVSALCMFLLGWFTADMLNIINYVGGVCTVDCTWATGVMNLVFWPLIAGYFIAIIQFWRGNDIL